MYTRQWESEKGLQRPRDQKVERLETVRSGEPLRSHLSFNLWAVAMKSLLHSNSNKKTQWKISIRNCS